MTRAATEYTRRINRTTANEWHAFSGHREQVTALALATARRVGREPSICVLGAGNANDLDLPAVLDHYASVHLVDIDAEALADGVERQQVAGDARITLHGAVDLTHSWPGHARFEVVLSAAVMSQLIDHAQVAVAPGDTERHRVALAARDQHVELLLALTEPGGVALLVTDVVSSDTVAELAETDRAGLGEVMVELVNARNFFTGCNPAAIAEQLVRRTEVASVSIADPWLWAIGTERCYLVTALVAEVSADQRGG